VTSITVAARLFVEMVQEWTSSTFSSVTNYSWHLQDMPHACILQRLTNTFYYMI